MNIDTTEMLCDDLALLEAGETENLHFAAVHGIQSRRWRFSWMNEHLSIDFNLPLERVLLEEETQQADNAEIAAAIRMALVLLALPGDADSDPSLESARFIAPGNRLEVTHDGETASWRVISGDGEVLEDSEDWSSLVAMLETATSDEGETVIIRP